MALFKKKKKVAVSKAKQLSEELKEETTEETKEDDPRAGAVPTVVPQTKGHR